MKYFELMIVLLIFGSCKNNSHTNKYVLNESKTKKSNIFSERELVNCEEYLDFDSLTIDGKLKYENTLNDLYLYAGKPDSIVKKEDVLSLHNDSIYEIYYYKTYDFIVYNKLAFLDRIKFRNNNVQLSFPSIHFNKDTKKEEIKKVFPCTYENKFDTLEIKNEMYERIYFLLKPKYTSHWNIFYKDNKLVEIEFKIPG